MPARWRRRDGVPPGLDNLVRMIKKWEAGRHLPGERYQLLYGRVFGISRDLLFGTRAQPVDSPPEPVSADEVTRSVFGLVQNGRQRLGQTRELYVVAARGTSARRTTR
ncbi:hypothetical protein FHR32_003166 [Streptosporangium album]|uniref:Uncharacterized protein n=1 Tax=Streptosporangium album TaxID=47479 RepID=A0A7W7RWU0_9ACTN|nr:hypothetical protein [Streptosporangium album]MBB4938861.1 hypothetical protein [Streptosporangium album]